MRDSYRMRGEMRGKLIDVPIYPLSTTGSRTDRRRGWDSNPRWSYPHSGFRDRPVQPLQHLSASGQQTNIVFCFRWSFREGKQMKRATKSAAKLVVVKNNDPISEETEQLQGRIRDRAYQLSRERGHAGREVDDWLTAESEIVSVPPAELI